MNKVEEIEFEKNSKNAGYIKFRSFEHTIRKLFPSVKLIEMNEHNCRYKLAIRNGVKEIAGFYFIAIDKMTEQANSVGLYKIHSYQLSIECIFKNNVSIHRIPPVNYILPM